MKHTALLDLQEEGTGLETSRGVAMPPRAPSPHSSIYEHEKSSS